MLVLLTAAALLATPANLPQVLARARGGDTVSLAPGSYPTLMLEAREFTPPLTIEAGTAAVAGLNVADVKGLVWRGGTLRAPIADGVAAKGYAVLILRSERITLRGASIGSAKRGIVMGASRDILIARNRIVGVTVDGINIGAGNSFITLDGNFCETFNTGKAHPDCYQAWSREGRPVSDIVVTNNIARGMAQGIYFGNVPNRASGGDPGFDRVRIENNTVDILWPNGIVATDCRDCVIRNNIVTSMPGARFRAKVLAVRGSGIACGNTVRALPQLKAVRPC